MVSNYKKQLKEYQNSTDERNFIRGFAVAIAELIRSHDQPTTAKDIMKSAGYTIDDFRKADVATYDMEPIEKALGQE